MLFNPMLSLSAFPYDFFQSGEIQHFDTPRTCTKSMQNNPPFFVKQCWDGDPEVEFLEEIQTEVLRVFLLAIHRHLY